MARKMQMKDRSAGRRARTIDRGRAGSDSMDGRALDRIGGAVRGRYEQPFDLAIVGLAILLLWPLRLLLGLAGAPAIRLDDGVRGRRRAGYGSGRRDLAP